MITPLSEEDENHSGNKPAGFIGEFLKEFVLEVGTKVTLLGKVFYDPFKKDLKVKEVEAVDVNREWFLARLYNELLWLKIKFYGFFTSVAIWIYLAYYSYGIYLANP